jgi:hypothetical protein
MSGVQRRGEQWGGSVIIWFGSLQVRCCYFCTREIESPVQHFMPLCVLAWRAPYFHLAGLYKTALGRFLRLNCQYLRISVTKERNGGFTGYPTDYSILNIWNRIKWLQTVSNILKEIAATTSILEMKAADFFRDFYNYACLRHNTT